LFSTHGPFRRVGPEEILAPGSAIGFCRPGKRAGELDRLCQGERVNGEAIRLAALPFPADTAKSFRESARMLHEQTREAYAHGEVPYELPRQRLKSRGVACA